MSQEIFLPETEMCATHIAPEDAPAYGEQGAKSDEAMAMYL